MHFAKGIGFGGVAGNPSSFRLWIEESLERGGFISIYIPVLIIGEAKGFDSNYESGYIFTMNFFSSAFSTVCESIFFEIEVLEIWGSGGLEAEAAQTNNRKQKGIKSYHYVLRISHESRRNCKAPSR